MNRPVRSLSSLGITPAFVAMPLQLDSPDQTETKESAPMPQPESPRAGWLRSVREDAVSSCGVSTSFMARKSLSEYMEDDSAGHGFDIRDNELDDDAFRLVTSYDPEIETSRPFVGLEPDEQGVPQLTVTQCPEQAPLAPAGEALQDWRDHWDDPATSEDAYNYYALSANDPVVDDMPTVADEERSAGGWTDVEPDAPDSKAVASLGPMAGDKDHRAFSEWTNYLGRLQRGRQELFCRLAEWLRTSSAANIRARWSAVRASYRASVASCLRAVKREEGTRKTKVDPRSSTAWLGLTLTSAQMKTLEAYRRVMLTLRDERRTLPALRWVDQPRKSLLLPANIRRSGCAKTEALASSGPRTFTPPATKRRVSSTRVVTLRRNPSVFSYAEPPCGAGDSVRVLARRESHSFAPKLDAYVRWTDER